jgi:hypothetical protein
MTWPADDLRRIAKSRLLSVNPQRADGTPSREFRTGLDRPTVKRTPPELPCAPSAASFSRSSTA